MKSICLATMLFAVLCSTSCRKSKGPDATTPIDSVVYATYPNYSNLKPGNYWIYEEYRLDSVDGAATPMGVYDSCFVDKDTIVNGHTYYKYWSPVFQTGTPEEYGYDFLRDSLSYTVSISGNVIFSSQDFTSVFFTKNYTNPPAGISDTILLTYQMGFKDSMITVPAGTFTTSTFRKMYHMAPPEYQYGPIRDYDDVYAEHVGLVRSTLGFYISSPVIYEKRLLRYHVQ